MRFLYFVITLLFCQAVIFAAKADNTEPFEKWLTELRSEATANGISQRVLDDAFKAIEPVESVIALDRKQPEHKITLKEYLKKTVTSARIQNGKNELASNRQLLSKVARAYSVPPNVIVALWGMETSYGENSGNFNVIAALATLAYEGRRSDFFRGELLKSLKIMQDEDISADNFTGSWAGAFGQCQFMPSSFLKYAVDFDKDGKRDIWFSQGDIFASIANYLHSEGWNYNGNIKEGNNNFKILLKWNRSRYFATAIGKLVKEFGE